MTGMNDVVEQDHQSVERIGDATLAQPCHDSVWTQPHAEGVTLVVMQTVVYGKSRHALARLSPDNARRVAAMLVARADAFERRAGLDDKQSPGPLS